MKIKNYRSLVALFLLLNLACGSVQVHAGWLLDHWKNHHHVKENECALKAVSIPENAVEALQVGESVTVPQYDPDINKSGYVWINWQSKNNIFNLTADFAHPNGYESYVNPYNMNDTTPNIGDWIWDAYINKVDYPTALTKFKHHSKNKTINVALWKEWDADKEPSLTGWEKFKNDAACTLKLASCKKKRRYKISGYASFDVIGGSLGFEKHKSLYSMQLKYNGRKRCFNRAPEAKDQNITTPEDTPIAFNVEAIDLDNDQLGYKVATQSAHGTLSKTATGYLYTPDLNYFGKDIVHFEVSDGVASTHFKVNVDVTPVNDAPEAKPQQVETIEDTPKSITLFGSDIDSQNLSYVITTQPRNGIVSLQGNEVVYTPAADYFGDDSLVYRVSDGDLSSEATINITVTPVNDAPVAQSQQLQTREDIALTLLLKGTDVDSQSLTYEITQMPANGKLVGQGNQFIYSPKLNFSGKDTLVFTVSDGEHVSQGVVDITVTPVNDAPVAKPQSVETLQNQAKDITLTGTDVDSTELSYLIKTQPSHGTVSLVNDKVTYTPNTNYVGSDSFVYTVSDGELVAEATVAMVVKPDPSVPIITLKDVSKTTFKNMALPVDVLRDNDLTDEGYSIVVVSQPASGRVAPVSGKLVYTPAQNYVGTDRFTYKVTRDNGQSNVATVSLRVTEPSNQGREFWLTLLKNSHSSREVKLTLFLSSLSDTTVMVDMPLLNYKKEVQLTANTVSEIDMSELYEQIPRFGSHNTDLGIYVHSDDFFSVYALNNQRHSTDAASIIPVSSLGTDYVHAGYVESLNSLEEIAIVATEDDTEVQVFRYAGKANEKRPDSGKAYTVSLKRGETHHISGYFLGGTYIASNKKVAFFTGNDCTNVKGAYCDHLYEQIASIENWSTEILTAPLATRKKGDTYRVYAAYDATKVYINQHLVATLDKGEIYDSVLVGANRIQSDKPVWVNQFSNGSAFDHTTSDPFMMGLTSTANFLNSYVITAPALEGFETHYANIIIQQNETNTVQVNGKLLASDTVWQPIQGSDYVYVQLQLDAGIHNLTAQGKFGLTVYGYGKADSYGYNAGYNFENKQTRSDTVLSTNEDTALQVDIIPDNATITQQPLKGSLEKADSHYVYMPPKDFFGLDEIHYQYDDDTGDKQTIVLLIDVLPVDDAPDPVSKSFMGVEDVSRIELKFSKYDKDNDALTFSFKEAQHAKKLRFYREDNQYMYFWYTPEKNYFGTDTVVYEISDGTSQSTATANITIAPVNDRPVVKPFTVTSAGETVVFDLTQDENGVPRGTDVEDSNDKLTYSLSYFRYGKAVQEGNLVYFTPEAGFEGQAYFAYYVTDTEGSSSVTEPVIVMVKRVDETAPEVNIAQINDTLFVTKPTDIIGSVADNKAGVSWSVSVYDSYNPDGNNPDPIMTNTGTGNVTGTLASIDPTLLVNGAYTLVVEVTDAAGNTTLVTNNLVIDGKMKLGELAFTLEDQVVPMPSLDVSIQRSYDSRLGSRSGDFGHGWTLGAQQLKLRESRPMHTGWEAYMKRVLATSPDGKTATGTICLRPRAAFKLPVVTVTMPGGDVETFQPTLGCTQGIYSLADNKILGSTSFALTFAPVGNTQSSLVLPERASVFYQQGRWATSNTSTSVDGTQAPDVFVPKRFRLTTKEGTQYEFSRPGFPGKTKLEKITDTTGKELTISDAGITHSQGTAVNFVRDGANRITQVTLPDSTAWQYGYDAAGDLVQATAPNGTVNKYEYDANHRLLKITDKDGKRLAGYEYDADGRLVAMIDANGQTIKLEHQLDANQQKVTDQNGNATTYTYDDYGNVTREEDALGNVTLRSFDNSYNKLSETDANGNTTSWTYDDKNNQLTEKNALGQVTSYTYDSRSRMLTETDHTGRVVSTNTYDGSGQLTSLKDAAGNVTGMTYDGSGLTGITDALGNETKYVYNGDDITEMTDALGKKHVYTYDDNNRKTQEVVTYTDGTGIDVTYTNTWVYDSKGRVTSETINGVTTTKTYGEADEVLTSQTGDDITTYVYDDNKKLIQTTYPDGSVMKQARDANGNVVKETDALGRETVHEYDALNRKIKTTYPDGSSMSMGYDGVGNVLTETDARGNVTTHTYDKLNRKLTTTDALNNTHSYTYDEEGRLVEEKDKLGQVTKYEYNSIDQRIKTTYADGTTMQVEYDALGRKTADVNALGQRTEYSYNALGNLTQVTDALNQVTAYGYNTHGNKVSQTDALGRVTTWNYGQFQRMTHRYLPDNQASNYTGYNLKGLVTRQDDFNGRTTQYRYDDQDRLVLATYADGSKDITDYDAVGNRITTQVIDAQGNNQTTRYSYDSLNRLSTETRFLQNQPNGDVLSYGYDAAGNKTRVTLTASNGFTQETTHSYDALNRLASTTDSSGTTSYTYNAVGNKASETKPNGVTTTYSYNSKNQLTQMEHSKDNTVLARYSYTLDLQGKRTQLVEEVFGNAPKTTTSTWEYDALGRLTKETVDGSTTTHEYDAVSNRVKQVKDGVVTNYTYDVNDRLTEETGARTASYTYDKQGNTLTQTVNGVTTNYSYNAKHELIQANDVSFHYDIDGVRSSKTKAGTTIDYTTDKNRDYAQVVLEKQNNQTVAAYTYGDDLLSQTISTGTNFYGYDGLGSTKFLTNTQGQITDTYQYDAYGEITSKTGTTDNNYLYTGEQYDRSLNQYYLRARYYNQGVGRFTQMDTWQGRMGNPTTLNKYLYADARPTMYVDPTGQFSLGGMMSGLNAMGTLASIATADYPDLFDMAASDGMAAAGATLILSTAGKKLLKPLSKICKTKSKKNNRCKFAVGWMQAYAKMQLIARTTPNKRLYGGEIADIKVVAGAFDIDRARGTADTNGTHKYISSALRNHAEKYGIRVGQQGACGTRFVVGRCAEWRAASKLTRSGSKVKNIRWIKSRYVDPSFTGYGKLGNVRKACGICNEVGFNKYD